MVRAVRIVIGPELTKAEGQSLFKGARVLVFTQEEPRRFFEQTHDGAASFTVARRRLCLAQCARERKQLVAPRAEVS